MPIVALPDGREVEFPEGASPDLITGALRKDFPQFFGGIDRAHRRESLQAQQAAARDESTRLDNGRGFFGDAVTRFDRDMALGATKAVQGAARAADMAQDVPPIPFMGGIGMDRAAATAAEVNRTLTAQMQERSRTRSQRLQESPTYQFGAELGGAVSEYYDPNPARDQTLAAGLISGVASTVPVIALGAVNPALAAAQYGLSQGEDMAQEAEATGKPEAADIAFLAGAGVGAASEVLMGAPLWVLGRIKALRKSGVTPQEAAGPIKRWLSTNPVKGEILQGSAREAVQEGTEQAGQNYIASDMAGYDPERPLGRGVGQAAALGGLTGGLVSGAFRSAAQQDARNFPATTRITPDGREVIVNQETGTTEFAAPAPAAAQLSTLNSQLAPATAIFRGPNGEDIRVDLGGATLEQAQAAIFRQQPGAEFVGVEGAVSPISPPETVPPEATPASTAAPALAGALIQYSPFDFAGGMPATGEREDGAVEFPYSAAKAPATPQLTTELVSEGRRVVATEFPVADIEVDAVLLPQFKDDADPKTGEVKGEELKGQRYERPSNPIVVWQLANGRNVVVTGRHRFALAKRLGETTIPATVVREADGFTRQQAITLDAEFNIRDGNGSVNDYATYFENIPALTEAEARARGLLDRAKGNAAWHLAKSASDDLKALYRAGKVGQDKAVAIAALAPGDAGAQQVGIKYALAGKPVEFISNLMRAAQAEAGQRGQTLDLFGADDSAMRQMEERAERASQFQKELAEQVRAVSGAAKNPQAARKLGVDVSDPDAVLRKVSELKADLARWQNWPLHPDLVAKVKAESPSGVDKSTRKVKSKSANETRDRSLRPAQAANEGLARDAAEFVRRGGAPDVGERPAPGEIERQSTRLVEWARARGLILPADFFAGLKKHTGTTAEHEVFYRPADQRAIKRTYAGSFGVSPRAYGPGIGASPDFYLRRMDLMNRVFDSGIRLEGVSMGRSLLTGKGEEPSVVVSQPWHEAANIDAPHPTAAQISEFMRGEGFEALPKSYFGWWRASDGVRVLDARDDNFILSRNGVVPIDLVLDQPAVAPETGETPPTSTQPDFSLSGPESVEQQQARLAQEQAQRETLAQKDKLAEQAAKPLTGTTGDLGQGDLLDAPDDLFAPPTPQAKTIAEAVATPDAVAATLLDEAADPVAAKLADIKADEADKFIEDFGEKIVGARKDLWATFKKRASEALPADAADITISSAFPEPDYEEALRQGVPMESLATFKALRDMVPAKPRQSWKLERWVELVRGLHALTSQLVQGQLNLTPERLAELVNNRAFGRIAQRVRLYRTLGYPAFTQAKDWSTVTGSYSVYRSQQFNPPKTITSAEHKGRSTDLEAEGSGPEAEAQVAELIRRKIAEAASQPKADDKVEFKLFKDRLTGDLFIGKKAVNGVVRLKTGFKSVKEARQFIADQQAELEAQWAGLKAHPEYRRAINLPRQGPVRREGDVSPQLFQDAFGFRGVQFGNWVESDRRQVDLNEAFDALMDMAQALGVPPKALSLDGSLGLAFGARGTAGAKAHYEPGEVVINITKKSGPGSLAHEWFHAVDNYFARLDRTGKTEPKSLDAFATSNLRPAVNLRPEVAAAFKRVRDVLGMGTFAARSGKLDEARSKAYYGTTIEKAARAFEQYVVDRLALAGISNDYLVNLVKDESPALPTQAEMDGGIRQAFDALFEAVEVVPDVPSEVVDAKLKSWLDQHAVRPGMLYANPFLDPKFWQAVAVSGARMLRDLGQFTVTQAKWSAAMLKKFGQRIQQALAATWNRLMRLQTQQVNGVSAIGQGHLNQIEAASVNANIAEEQKPVYSEQDLAKGAPGLGIRLQPMSKQIAFLGGKALLGAKQKLDVTGALQAAAVKKQSDNLWQQLVESSASGNPLTKWKLPAWLIGSPRARAFKQRVLHIAARLNATGRDAAGNFTFADFTMRAGTMSLGTAKQSQLSVGDQFTVNDPLTGVTETLTLGPIITTPEGRVFHQLARPVDGATQAELYQHFAREYPEMIWFLDMFIDPALAGLRQTINGIEVPVFNRFAAAAMMADGNPNFSPLTAYTPDVLVTRSLIGAISGAWHKSGVRSPGRKYKSGTSREGGHVRDLLSGFNVRSWQMLQEKSRREWMQAVLKSATPIKGGELPNKGWVKLETGMEELWQAVKRLRNWKSPVDPLTGAALFPETEQRATDDGSAEYKAFFLEAMKLRGKQLMLPQTLVDQLVRKYVAHVEHGTLYRLGSWLVRNSTQLFLVTPVTVVSNVLTNDLFTLEAATRRILSGVAGGKMQDIRFARELFTAEFFKWFPGLRTLVDPQWRATMNADVLPENLFADQTMLADLKVRLDEDPLTYLRQGEIGAAALNFIRYGNIDTRAKTRMAYAWLRAQAVTNARKAGLRGAALRASVDAYLANPPIADMAAAVEVAGFELLNYADSPAWLEDMANGKFEFNRLGVDIGDFRRLVMAFPRYGYHYTAKNATRASAVKVLLGKVPKGQRADAFADLITFLMWPAGGLGILAAYGLKGLGDDDDEARKRVGTASIKTVDADGNVVSKPLPRDLITSNRINLSAWARGVGIGTDREEDAWLRIRSYQVISLAGAALLAEEDARKFGAAEGAKTYASAVKDIAVDFLSVGMALKVPAKILGDLGNTRNERTWVDPYAAGVPTLAYVVDQTLDSFLPGTRQFDIVVKWMDPIARRRGASKALGFDPTVWDAARVGHVTGLLDRLFAGADGTTASTLPPEGKIDRRSGTVPIPQEYTLQQRIAELVGFNIRPIDRSRYEEALSPYATRN